MKRVRQISSDTIYDDLSGQGDVYGEFPSRFFRNK